MKKISETQMFGSDLPPELSQPAQRALAQAGILKLEQFVHLREEEVLKLHGMGPKAIEHIRLALADSGKSFAH